MKQKPRKSNPNNWNIHSAPREANTSSLKPPNKTHNVWTKIGSVSSVSLIDRVEIPEGATHVSITELDYHDYNVSIDFIAAKIGDNTDYESEYRSYKYKLAKANKVLDLWNKWRDKELEKNNKKKLQDEKKLLKELIAKHGVPK